MQQKLLDMLVFHFPSYLFFHFFGEYEYVFILLARTFIYIILDMPILQCFSVRVFEES